MQGLQGGMPGMPGVPNAAQLAQLQQQQMQQMQQLAASNPVLFQQLLERQRAAAAAAAAAGSGAAPAARAVPAAAKGAGAAAPAAAAGAVRAAEAVPAKKTGGGKKRRAADLRLPEHGDLLIPDSPLFVQVGAALASGQGACSMPWADATRTSRAPERLRASPAPRLPLLTPPSLPAPGPAPRPPVAQLQDAERRVDMLISRKRHELQEMFASFKRGARAGPRAQLAGVQPRGQA